MPIPQPKQNPNDRNRCQICVAADAAKRPVNTSAEPSSMVNRVPMRFWQAPDTGEIKSAWEMDNPPIMAYSNVVASVKVFMTMYRSRKIPQDELTPHVQKLIMKMQAVHTQP